MKNPTSKDKWLMVLTISNRIYDVLFDGESVYDYNFPTEKIVNIRGLCGNSFGQETLAAVCKRKMEGKKVVCSAFDGTWTTEDENTPFTSSIGSETYWCS